MKIIKHILHGIKTTFLSGLFTIFPIGLTIFFVAFVYNFVYRALAPLRNVSVLVNNTPGAEFFIATVCIILIGLIIRSLIISSVLEYSEQIITRVPIISIIYSSAKIMVDFFKATDNQIKQHRKVVLVQFPRQGFYNIAFLLAPADDSYAKLINQQESSERYFKVFMPTAPNPTTGYFLILPESEIIHTPITFEEGIKTLVSCGLITPDSLKKML